MLRPTAAEIAAYQTGPTAGWPFPAIAYELVALEDGTICVCGELEEERWSNGVGSPTSDPNGEGIYNQESTAICISGDNPTPAQWASVQLAHPLVEQVVDHALVITAHGLLPGSNTECAGAWINGRLSPPPI